MFYAIGSKPLQQRGEEQHQSWDSWRSTIAQASVSAFYIFQQLASVRRSRVSSIGMWGDCLCGIFLAGSGCDLSVGLYQKGRMQVGVIICCDSLDFKTELSMSSSSPSSYLSLQSLTTLSLSLPFLSTSSPYCDFCHHRCYHLDRGHPVITISVPAQELAQISAAPVQL